MAIEYVLYGVIGLFVLILIVKALLGKIGEKLCAICLSFSLTWIFLLVMYYLDRFENLLLIGLMMGLTILGLFYTWERNVKKQATIFRLPLLLTLVLVGYYLLTFENLIREASLLAVLWVLFGIFYLYRNNRNLKGFIDKIVECCKKW